MKKKLLITVRKSIPIHYEDYWEISILNGILYDSPEVEISVFFDGKVWVDTSFRLYKDEGIVKIPKNSENAKISVSVDGIEETFVLSESLALEIYYDQSIFYAPEVFSYLKNTKGQSFLPKSVTYSVEGLGLGQGELGTNFMFKRISKMESERLLKH